MAVLAAPALLRAAQPGKSPVKVFLLAGQSNMEGQAVVDLDHPKYYNGGKGHHWFGNAESYFLIGDALGKGMKKLLTNAAKE